MYGLKSSSFVCIWFFGKCFSFPRNYENYTLKWSFFSLNRCDDTGTRYFHRKTYFSQNWWSICVNLVKMKIFWKLKFPAKLCFLVQNFVFRSKNGLECVLNVVFDVCHLFLISMTHRCIKIGQIQNFKYFFQKLFPAKTWFLGSNMQFSLIIR